ncbi:RHS repeat-associated core domain-containing protein [Acinetobacter baumannii]
MKTIMKSEMKNNDMYSKKIWSSAAQLVLFSLILLLSQFTLAKDRIQYHIQNFDGSTLKVINDQGIVSQSYQYAPFGQQLQLKKPSNLNNPQAFVGSVQDANDLVYLKQRHYNPVLGRFYQPDPVTFISGGHGQINPYQYGWNDSYTYRDITGTTVTEAFGGLLVESWYAVTGQPYNYSNVKDALFNGYNGTGWEATTSFFSDCLNFCTLGVSGAAVNGVKFGINEARIFAASTKFALPEINIISRGAESSLQGAKLTTYYTQFEKYGAGGVKELTDGRFRFYGEFIPAKKSGEMMGARLVREWNPSTNLSRTWYETLDHAGRIRSVAPKPVLEPFNHRIFDVNGKYIGRR